MFGKSIKGIPHTVMEDELGLCLDLCMQCCESQYLLIIAAMMRHINEILHEFCLVLLLIPAQAEAWLFLLGGSTTAVWCLLTRL